MKRVEEGPSIKKTKGKRNNVGTGRDFGEGPD